MNINTSLHLCAAAGLALLFAAMPAPAGETLTTLKDNIFICVSPQAYDDAMARVRELSGKDLEPLKKELSEQKQCMFVDKEMVADLMAPYAVVLERESSKVRVQFILQDRKKIEFLHRLINRYVLVGWTEEANLEPKQVL
jgi:hypothetical protein